MPTRTPSRTRAAADQLCVDAVEAARAAAREEGGDFVGEHLSTSADGARIVTHYFATTQPGYVGWRWAVTVVRASRARLVTVDDVVLLPGDGAVLAPEWLPWSERLQPGDLGVGDLLPTAPDDERLVPAYVRSEDPEVEELALEVGLGRIRVMSRLGREDAAIRWQDGETGPRTAMATHAPGRCAECGFFLSLAGWLRPAFGVCGNEFAPADGRIVSAAYGCGAHSESPAEATPRAGATGSAYDDAALDMEPQRPGPADGADDPGQG